MTAPDLIRDELTRAARELGAPDSVAPVLERPRDPAFGEWTTNLAMTLAKPLKRKPQEIALDLIGRMNLERATVSEAGPAPMRATRLPFFDAALAGSRPRMSSLLSAATRLSRQIATGSFSTRPRRQAGSHGRSQVRPRMPGKTLLFQLTM